MNLTTAPFHPLGEGKFKKQNMATSKTKTQKNNGYTNSIILSNYYISQFIIFYSFLAFVINKISKKILTPKDER